MINENMAYAMWRASLTQKLARERATLDQFKGLPEKSRKFWLKRVKAVRGYLGEIEP